VLIGGTSYAGEMKKSVFTYLNYLLPPQGVMPMHCSANVGPTATRVFFGLSGTGKTTLSADPNRTLIGDDEHGWGPTASSTSRAAATPRPSALAARPSRDLRHHQALRHGAGERRVDPVARDPDFDDEEKTENTRSAYPLDFIPNASRTGRAGHPKNIIMLTCDAFGVMPPIAKLTPAQAMYHFLSGYTAKVAGTEKGVTEPSRPSPPASARRSCRAIRRNTATCCATDRQARCRLLAGQHRLDRRQATASAAACRSRSRARC
jgi:phosphoenolpyruvate carboxykinase (ATP)